jgi:sugar phosphate isomerase/epimerase
VKKADIREYARLGLVHHLLYPKCTVDPDDHVQTLLEFVRRPDIETLDCCIPFGAERRQALIPAVRGCGKEVVYAMHLFPLRKISFGTCCPQEQGLIRLAVRDQIEMAVAAGATGFIFASGADVAPAERPAARRAFANFCRWFAGELRPHGMTALLEPFDRTIDKKFLYGPSTECVELVESLRPEVDNLAIELDMAHVPLMGETFEQAIRTCVPHVKRVHLGNCVKRHPESPWYGDKHPPIGLEGGEIDVPELAGILALLLDVGYLNRENRGALILEVQCFPGLSPAETVQDNLRRLGAAWDLATR